MNRIFCDMCGAEVTQSNKPRGGQGGNPVSDWRLGGVKKKYDGSCEICFEVTTGNQEAWNKGDFCKHCIIDAVQSLDDRPRNA